MPAAQEDMIARPDAVIMGISGVIMMMAMTAVMGMTMIVPVGMPMCVVVKAVPVGVIVRHGVSLAPSGRKIAP
jgi:hypothetical protein